MNPSEGAEGRTDSRARHAVDGGAHVVDGPVRRMVDILGMSVVGADGGPLGLVNDLRLDSEAPDRAGNGELVVAGVIISGRHAGSLLGYDRYDNQGPAVLGWIVRRLHRHARYLPWESIGSVDWGGRRIIARREPEALRATERPSPNRT